MVWVCVLSVEKTKCPLCVCVCVCVLSVGKNKMPIIDVNLCVSVFTRVTKAHDVCLCVLQAGKIPQAWKTRKNINVNVCP